MFERLRVTWSLVKHPFLSFDNGQIAHHCLEGRDTKRSSSDEEK
jgi:hypothetical protein